jgi:hypothetical protein
MNAALKGSCLLGMGIFVVFSGPPAHAAEEPLLVVVEAPPALDADAAEIRRAIGTELKAPTSPPMKATGEPAGRALIVALDHDRIAMSLRSGNGAPVGRIIPAPTDHAARLRAIAWLAGNLARDQVTPLVAEAAIDMPSLAAIPPATTLTPATEPPPLSVVATPTAPPEPVSDSPTISTQAREARIATGHSWTLGIADGPTTNFPLCKPPGPGWPTLCAPYSADYGGNKMLGTAWRLEIQRRSASEGPFAGAAVEGTAGSGFSPQLIGISAFVGSAKRHGQWTFEPTLGAGLELSYVFAGSSVVTSTHSSTSGFSSTVTDTDSYRPALSADGAVAVAHPISESLGAVLRLGAHLSTADFSAWFLSVTLGLRYNLL